ncbi:MAG: glycosyltransferase [Saprospiraceae bacterium]|nr:glycosyltransferase [Saprospiraceae bacterium]
MIPTFSIITVVYNGAAVVEKTIQSVLNQTFRNYEYLIIDGASKDETLNIIKKYNALYPLSIQWVSERDNGLYDAMNKGLRLAKGRFVLFLNAGDALFEKTTLQKIAHHIKPETDVLFGETMLVNTEGVHLGTRSALTVQKLPENSRGKA